MADLFCGQCGAKKKPLAYSTYCPNDCDRLVPRREAATAAEQEGPPSPSYSTCPKCGTDDTEPFLCKDGDMHCVPNGHVWWDDPDPDWWEGLSFLATD